jgi:hypothetical protein
MVYTKFRVLNIIYKFVVDFFLFEVFRFPNTCCKFIGSEIQNFEFLNDLECSLCSYQSFFSFSKVFI